MNTKRLRTIIPLAVIAVVAVGFATHVGVGTLSAIGWQDISLLCPLGALMTMIATKTMIPRAVISVVIAIALILLFARAFCGWVCPVPVVSKIRGIFSKKTSNTDMTGTGVLPASENPLVKAAVAAGRETYVSPTTSDRTLMPFPALKMGPGQSSRSHTADEFVLLEEIAEGIAVYEKYIGKLAQEYGWKTLG